MYNSGQFFVGVVEDRNDPLHLGRVRARIVGLHTHNQSILPTKELPWAMVMQAANSNNSSEGVGLLEGTTVIVIFNDYPECQQPIVIGKIAGIPQEQTAFIDSYEEPPAFVDDITPQGRKIDTSVFVSQSIGKDNPVIDALSEQSIQEKGNQKRRSLLTSILEPTTKTFQTTGKLLDSVSGIGYTIEETKNSIENLYLLEGGIDKALDKFITIASQSGKYGSGIAAVLNGKANIQNLLNDFEGTIDNVQSSFNNIKKFKFGDINSFSDAIDAVKDVRSVIVNAEQIVYQIGSATENVDSIISTIQNEIGAAVSSAGDLSLQSIAENTIQQIIDIGVDVADAAIIDIEGVIAAGVGQIQEAQDSINDLADVLGISKNEILSTPENVATIITKEYSATRDALKENIGNISVIGSKEEPLTQSDFKDVDEGITPPVRGSYGGPNFAGAEPFYEEPANPADDVTLYDASTTSTKEIKTEPPPWWKGNRARATEGIQALLAVCDKKNFTNEQKAALLGIVGAESGWQPVEESAQYTDPNRLCQVFKSTFKNNKSVARKYCNWVKGKKGPKADFFDFVYDPSNNGRQLGNRYPGDGGKFFGRGFIQLTGRSNYERYATISKYPIDKQPELLISDINISAEIAVLYFLDRVTKGCAPTAHPGYFYAAKKAIGNNTPDIARRKLEYYEYFYGTRTPEGYRYTENIAGSTLNRFSYQGVAVGSNFGQDDGIGFKDPNKKYPLPRRKREQETSRLARGVIKETVVSLKQSQRTLGVPVAMDGLPWNQPEIPYGAKYPYNRVIESESGHIQEIDDTPGYERTHFYHRAGTFTEVDSNGTEVHKIVGDGYVIYDNNGFISIAGDCNVTVAGNINVYCMSSANVEVAGSAELKIGGSMDIGIAKDMNIAVGGDFSLWANGNMNLQSKKSSHIRSNDSMFISTDSQLHVLSLGDTYRESAGDCHTTVGVNSYNTIKNNYHLNVGSKTLLQSDDDTNIKASSVKLSANDFNVDVSDTQLGGTTTGTFVGSLSGVATHALIAAEADGDGTYTPPTITAASPSSADSADIATEATKALVHGMIPPAIGRPLYPSIEPFVGPPLLGEEHYTFELPEDGSTLVSQKYQKQQVSLNGITNNYASEFIIPAGGGGTVVSSQQGPLILSKDTFTADYPLSTHFVLGDMFDGGFGARHKLVTINGLTPQQIVYNLSQLAENILEKYLAYLPGGIGGKDKQWRISSGYRQESSRSDHPRGRAVDIALIGGNDRKKRTFDLIKELDKAVQYDQLILEYNNSAEVWIHTSFRGQNGSTYGGGSNRSPGPLKAFTMRNHSAYDRNKFVLLS